MSPAEKLARHIWRVADLRRRLGRKAISQDALHQLDQLLDKACHTIGTGDEGHIEAVGLELEAVQ